MGVRQRQSWQQSHLTAMTTFPGLNRWDLGLADYELSSRGAKQPARLLTEQELQVFRLVAAGVSNKEIASDLAISEKTVNSHMVNVLRTTGARDRTAATRWLERQGTVTSAPEDDRSLR